MRHRRAARFFVPALAGGLLTGGLAASAPAAAADAPPGPYREAATPLPMPAAAAGVGTWIPDLPFTDVDGAAGRLSGVSGTLGTVLVMRDATCPMCRRYGPTLARLEATYAPRGFEFVYVNASAHDDLAARRADRDRFGLSGRYVAEGGPALAQRLGAVTTTEVFVLDRARTVRYRGAVNDQYGIGVALDAPRRRYLADALDALVTERDIVVAATNAPGCRLDLDAAAPPPAPVSVTYHNTISRILDARCVACHRDGAVGPFPLDRYDAVAGRKGMIRFVVDEGIMPPWHAAETAHRFSNDRSLTAGERDAILAWVEADCPEGDPAHAPLARTWPDEWEIGTPDVVFELPKTYRIAAEGTVEYQYAYVETDFPEDRWVKAMEIRPTAPQVVHHALVFAEREGARRSQSGLRGYFGALVPGQGPTIYPEGFGKRLPKGARLWFQMHYTPNGTAAFDRTRVGIIFADEPPQHVLRTAAVSTEDFAIPAGAGDHQVTASATFRRSGTLLAISPHMHLRGKAFRVEMTGPDGTTETILDVPRYDFEWQTMYRFAEPLFVEPNTTMTCTAWYDNSADNPANPDPTTTVRFGEQTWEEMMIGYFEWWADR